jgi:DNA-binding transcriptional MerR regulator
VRTGTTPRTIPYYEELGLLPARPAAAKGTHRPYDEGDVETLDSLVRLRERRKTIAELEAELVARRALIESRLAESR